MSRKTFMLLSLLFSLLLVILFGCIKKESSWEESAHWRDSFQEKNEEKSDNNEGEAQEHYQVTLFAPEGEVVKRVHLYLYSYLRNPEEWDPWPNSPITLHYGEGGKLLLKEGGRLLLPPGSYTLYGVAVATEGAEIPKVERGRSAPLKQGVSYLLAKSNIVSLKEHFSLPLQFKNLSSALTLNLSIEEEEEKLKVEKLTIIGAKEGATFTFSSGEIEAVKGNHNSRVEMELKEGSARLFLLPIEGGVDLQLEVVLRDLPSGKELLRRGAIKTPESGFRGGYRYHYTATIVRNAISFSEATVTKWELKEVELPLIEE